MKPSTLRMLVWAALTLSVLVLVTVVLDSTTPDECRVGVEHMSHACQRLLYP